MSEFPGNSRQEKDNNEITSESESEEVRSERVVFADDIIRRPKPVGRKLVDLVGGVIKELAQDILIPALKDTARNFVTQGIDRALYRDSDDRYHSDRGYRHHTPSRVRTTIDTPYNQMSRSSSRDRYDRGRRTHHQEPIDLNNVVLRTHVAAESVIEEMVIVLRKYGVVTIADLNHILGQDQATVPTDHNWGWYETRGIRVERVREGYLLVFPRPEDVK